LQALQALQTAAGLAGSAGSSCFRTQCQNTASETKKSLKTRKKLTPLVLARNASSVSACFSFFSFSFATPLFVSVFSLSLSPAQI
jgi:hypothetical protein